MGFIKNIFIGFTVLLSFVACQNEDLPATLSEGEGKLVISGITVDVSTTDGVAATRSDGTFTAPDASELTYTLINNTTGSIEYEQNKIPTDMLLSAGNYTLKAVYGENKMGLIPYLYHSVTFDIEKGKVTNLTDFTVGLACAIIRPVISSELQAQYQNSLAINLSDGTTELSGITNNMDYFVPITKNYTLTCTGTNLIGKTNSFTTHVNNAVAKTRYNLNCSPTLPVFQLPAQPDVNAWAKRIYITPLSENDITDAKGANKQTLLDNIVYEVSTDGTNWISAIKQNNGTWLASELTTETNYAIRARLNNTTITSSNTASLITEAATGVPNGDFETLVQTISVSKMNQGGNFRAGAIDYQNKCTFIIKEPEGWSSVNAKTCNTSASNQMSWYVVPSTYNTTLSWTSYYGIVSNSDTPDIYKNLSAQSSNNAMIIRNVAWDANGTTPDKSGSFFNTTYYNTNVPSIANRSAGKLFLGSYSYSTNSTEDYNEGTEFTSRPLFLKGYYKYVNDSQDTNEKGTVIITLLNGDTTIGEGKVELAAQNNYTEFVIPITYTSVICAKSTKLKIMISSSNHASYTQSEETAKIKTTIYNEQKETVSRGAMLTIDNLTFEY